jgi:pilus assembly protein CpaE
MTQDASHHGSAIVLIGADPALLQQAAAALGSSAGVPVAVIAEPIEHAAKRPELDSAAVVVVDLDPRRRESLIALQGITSRLFGRAPVIVLADTSDDTLLRWFMQVRVSDFLRKPVEPKEVVKACLRALKASSSLPDDGSQILSFLSAGGGVGATTLAIETAMLLRRAAPKDSDTVCLVDLDFQNGACADYLDLEPRLDLDEIGPHPDRLDLQLLEIMLTRHASGLNVVAARGRPAERCGLDASVIVRLLDLVSTRFAHVIIDLPRVWEPWTDQVLLGSNRVFVVTDMTVPGLRLGRRMAAALATRLPEVKPRVIVNRFEQHVLFGTGLRRADVERALDGFLEGTVANNYKLVREAIDRGLPLEQVKPGSNVSADLKRIVLAQVAAE